jgi:hypothetical protein
MSREVLALGPGVPPALRGGEALTDDGLDFRERRPELLDVALADGGQEAQQDQAAEAVGRALGDGRQPGERLGLGWPMEARSRRRDHDEDRPLRRELQARQEGGNTLASAPAAVDDEPALEETVQADARPPCPAGHVRQGLHAKRPEARQLEHGPSHGQTELRASP